ncbi:family 16 glycosylhydrolase [Granulosicoccus antarcticus]|uniref:Endo-1,3-1,4-beta-glycanase ExsH n=1 Tax=Granulosicoccus antarcticus IMCC3135 TaxID=1192854 RepID=A0A2Z2NYI8_9GAMM|nr:family 16 glycosylhydrolase [Granulosicoccus antarcticus]ASJ76502.1 Endo-1,3-1,4-beta-glycanase ExsH [Granulosicoccus antarcticus IMCC3135]
MRITLTALLLLGLGSANVHADNQRPSTVTNVQASTVSSSAIRINWSQPWDDVGVDGYNIYRNGSYYKTVFNTTNYIDEGVSANSSYEYSLVAFDRARNYSSQSSSSAASTGGSSSSSDSSFSAQPAAQARDGSPGAPSGLRAQGEGSDKIHLYWTAPSGTVTGYNIYRDGGYYSTIKGRTDYTASSLSSGRDYRWQVVAFNGSQYSTKSSEVVARTDSSSSSNAVAVVAAAAPPPQQTSVSGHVPSGYHQVFNEEFQSSSLNGSKWQSRYRWGPHWTINNEQQFYVDNINDPNFGHSPFEFDGENMTITATRTPDHLRSKANNKDYLSGTLTTYGKFKMRYGYVEMRARMPKGKGLWPAFWLLHNQENDKRPEIDVVEMLGDTSNKVYQTYHYFENWNLRSTPSYEYWGSDFSQDFHTFGMKWEPGRITWYVDGNATNSHSSGNVASEEMYLLVNLAVGGSWPGNPDGSTSFPARFTIDYIRAYSPD